MFKSINIDILGTNMNDKKLGHLPVVDNDIVTNNFKEPEEMLSELDLKSKEVRVNISINTILIHYTPIN